MAGTMEGKLYHIGDGQHLTIMYETCPREIHLSLELEAFLTVMPRSLDAVEPER